MNSTNSTITSSLIPPNLSHRDRERLRLKIAVEKERRRRQAARRDSAPSDWRTWLTTLFPSTFSAPFARRHTEFWHHIESIKRGRKVPAFFAIWPRGGGKTTNVEAAAVRLGAKEERKFCLYVRSTQDKANESVQAIAALLEGRPIAYYYPMLASRKLGKYGNSKGWKIDTLRCSNGFNVVGLGLDAAVRGIKIEEFRPDLIILDDIDDKNDSPDTIRKKIATITTSILPAGSVDVAVIGVQNLIHAASIFTQIAEDTAEFLLDRVVSGPYPAVENLTYEQKLDGRGYRITGGAATWAGQPLGVCENQINEWGLSAFLKESQHEVEESGGMFSHLDYRHCTFDELPDLVKVVTWVDPAVTSTDESDCHGIQIDGVAEDGTIYRLWSWEQISSPEATIRLGIQKMLDFGGRSFGVETNQGGDLWGSVYRRVWADLLAEGEIAPDVTRPVFRSAKADASQGNKAHRASLMLSDYERGRIVHVIGTHKTLERALNRFPLSKPYDLVDASFWSWQELDKLRVKVQVF